MFSQILTVFNKEWLEIRRDYRTLLTLGIMAIAAPLYMFFLINMISNRAESDTQIEANLVGEQQAPNLKRFLSDRGIEFTTFPTLEAARLENNDKKVVVVFEDDYREHYEASLPATVSLYINRKDDSASGDARQIRTLIRAYNTQIEAARLVSRGVSPSRVTAIAIEEYDLTTSGRASNFLAGFMLYMFIATAFAGTIAAAGDMVAGEKERHTLQPLLAQPVTKTSLVVGKWMTLASLGAGFAALAFLFGGFVISKAPLADAGATFYLDFKTLGLGAISLAGLATLAAAIQIVIAAMAKTYREAMTYLPWTALVPFAITFVPLFTDITYGGLLSYVPIFNQTYVLRELLLEGSVPIIQYFAGIATSFILAIVLLQITIRRFGNEKSLG